MTKPKEEGKDAFTPSDAREALWQSIWIVQQKMPILKKTADNPFFHSKYADLPGIMEVLQPLLTENQLILKHHGVLHPADPTMIGVETVLEHASGSDTSSTFFAKPAKAGAQEVGSCITYLRRYGLQALLAITAEDDDGEAAEGRTTPGKTATPAPKFSPPTTTTTKPTPGKKAPELTLTPTPLTDDQKRGALLKYAKAHIDALGGDVAHYIEQWSAFQRKDKTTKELLFDADGNPDMAFKTDVASLSGKWLHIAFEKGKSAYQDLETQQEQEVIPE